MSYKLKLPVFEGPFDLLLHLVKVNEMEISDIHISEITDQYLAALRLMQELDLEVAGDFLVMAATLIHLKVRALLPEPAPQPGAEEEGEEISDIVSAKQLMDQLIEYRRFKELSVDLAGRQEAQMRMFMRDTLLPSLENAQEQPPLRGQLQLLFDCFSRVLRYVESLPHHDVAYEPFSVEQRIASIRDRMRMSESLELFSLFKQCSNKADMIVTFLALLELSRLKEIRLEQSDLYQDVYVFRRAPEAADDDGDERADGDGDSAPTYAAAPAPEAINHPAPMEEASNGESE